MFAAIERCVEGPPRPDHRDWGTAKVPEPDEQPPPPSQPHIQPQDLLLKEVKGTASDDEAEQKQVEAKHAEAEPLEASEAARLAAEHARAEGQHVAAETGAYWPPRYT